MVDFEITKERHNQRWRTFNDANKGKTQPKWRTFTHEKKDTTKDGGLSTKTKGATRVAVRSPFGDRLISISITQKN
jgi:hypothetical protein